MLETGGSTSLQVEPLLEARHCAALREFGDYGVARVLRADANGAWQSGERLVAPRGAAQAGGGTWQVEAGHCLRLPADLDEHAALALPPLMAALGCWAALRLELGEVAAVCGATRLAALLRLTAYWQGAMPVIALGGVDIVLSPRLDNVGCLRGDDFIAGAGKGCHILDAGQGRVRLEFSLMGGVVQADHRHQPCLEVYVVAQSACAWFGNGIGQ